MFAGLVGATSEPGRLNPVFLSANPRPLCAFLSGNFKDWLRWIGNAGAALSNSQKSRIANLGLCGGAQGLAILAQLE